MLIACKYISNSMSMKVMCMLEERFKWQDVSRLSYDGPIA